MSSSVPYFEVSGEGEPVVLITGIATDTRAWTLQVPALAKHHRMIVLDNRGIGKGGPVSAPYEIADLATDVVAVLDAAGFARADVIGLSMGGMIAQELALRYPTRVRRLILAATSADCHPTLDEHRRRFLAAIEGANGGAAFWRHALPVLFSREFLENEWERLVELFGSASELRVDGLLAQLDAVSRHRTTDRLAEIEAPTLVLTADSDRLVPAECGDVLARNIPRAERQTVPGGSHCFHVEMPDTFNRIVLEFLSRS